MKAARVARQYQVIGLWALTGAIAYMCLAMLAPFTDALMWAAILSVLTYPLFKKQEAWLQSKNAKYPTSMAGLLTIGGTLVTVAIPLALVGIMVGSQFNRFIGAMETGKSGEHQKLSIELAVEKVDEIATPLLEQVGSDFKVGQWYEENRSTITRSAGTWATQVARQGVVTTVMMVVAFLTMYFMLTKGHKLLNPVLELMPIPEGWTMRILIRLQKTMHAVFMGVVLVALIQGGIATIAYGALGVDAWLVWGAATTLLCAIPLLGAPIIYVPLALLMISQGKIWQAITLLAVGFVLVSQADNLIRPKYIGDRVGLGYLPVFFSLLGGVILFGAVGLFAGPAVLTVALELIEYFREARGISKADDEGALDPA